MSNDHHLLWPYLQYECFRIKVGKEPSIKKAELMKTSCHLRLGPLLRLSFDFHVVQTSKHPIMWKTLVSSVCDVGVSDS